LTRILIIAIILTTLVFTTAIVLMRLPPYQDGGLHDFLTPPADCAAPCWLGVRPGVSTLSGSSQILGRSAWIKTLRSVSPATALLDFSKSIPAVGRGTLNLWEGGAGIVTQISLFDTGLSYSDIQLALGMPQRLFLNRTVQYGTNHLIAVYTHYNLAVITHFYPCRLDQRSFWKAAENLTVTIGDWQVSVNNPRNVYYVSSIELDPPRWATQVRRMHLCNP
jgi:hypothetical protein